MAPLTLTTSADEFIAEAARLRDAIAEAAADPALAPHHAALMRQLEAQRRSAEQVRFNILELQEQQSDNLHRVLADVQIGAQQDYEGKRVRFVTVEIPAESGTDRREYAVPVGEVAAVCHLLRTLYVVTVRQRGRIARDEVRENIPGLPDTAYGIPSDIVTPFDSDHPTFAQQEHAGTLPVNLRKQRDGTLTAPVRLERYRVPRGALVTRLDLREDVQSA